MRKQSIVFLTVWLLSVAVTAAQAASREKVFTGFAANQVFQAAIKAARENFMLTYVNEKNMTFVFHTDASLTYDFDWKASVTKTRDGVELVLNVPSQPQVLGSGLGERIAERLFEAAGRILQLKRSLIVAHSDPSPETGFSLAMDERRGAARH